MADEMPVIANDPGSAYTLKLSKGGAPVAGAIVRVCVGDAHDNSLASFTGATDQSGVVTPLTPPNNNGQQFPWPFSAKDMITGISVYLGDPCKVDGCPLFGLPLCVDPNNPFECGGPPPVNPPPG